MDFPLLICSKCSHRCRPSPTASPLRGPSSSSAPPSGSGSPSGHAQAQSFPQPFWTTPHATQPLQAQAPIVVEDSTDKEAAGISSDATPAVSNGPAEETSPPTRCALTASSSRSASLEVLVGRCEDQHCALSDLPMPPLRCFSHVRADCKSC